jgi:hypothetical protein
VGVGAGAQTGNRFFEIRDLGVQRAVFGAQGGEPGVQDGDLGGVLVAEGGLEELLLGLQSLDGFVAGC